MDLTFTRKNWIYSVAYAALLFWVLGGVFTSLQLNGLILADHLAMTTASRESLRIEQCKALVSEVRYVELARRTAGLGHQPSTYTDAAMRLQAEFASLTGQPANPDVRPISERVSIDAEWTPAHLDTVIRKLNAMGEVNSARHASIDKDWNQHEARRLLAMRLIGATLLGAIVVLGSVSKRRSAASRREFTIANELQLRMKWLAMHFPVPSVYVEGELVIINRCAQELTGYSRREITTLDEWFKLLHRENAVAARVAYEAGKRGGFRSIPLFTILRKDGAPMQIELAAHSGRGGEVWVLRDVTELFASRERLRDANRKLQELAAIDGLTGLMNRRVFFVRLLEECELSLRLGRQLSVLLFDVDEFKAYNDTFGHPAGDQVLRTISELSTQASRAYDCVARYGGEEFALILPGTGRFEAIEVGDNVRQTIEAFNWPDRKVTVSVGVTTAHHLPVKADELIAEADKALYAAKNAGRNQVVHHAGVEQATEFLHIA